LPSYLSLETPTRLVQGRGLGGWVYYFILDTYNFLSALPPPPFSREGAGGWVLNTGKNIKKIELCKKKISPETFLIII
jgi:hypothetical protein